MHSRQVMPWWKQPAPSVLSCIKVAVFIMCLLPVAELIWRGYSNQLGTNPIEYVTHATGTWTLRFLLICLSITPLRKYSGLHWLMRLRRMLGLYAFFYACLHLTTYLWLDQFFDVAAIIKDIAKRPFITIGFAAFVLMLPLAVTSTNTMMKRLGGKRWQQLHRCIYAVAIFGVIHYWWLVKRDITKPLIYGGLLGILLGVRLVWRAKQHRTPGLRGQIKA